MPLFNAVRMDVRRLVVLGVAAVASLAMASSAHAVDFNLNVDVQGAGRVTGGSASCESSLGTPQQLIGMSCPIRTSFRTDAYSVEYDASTLAPGWRLKAWHGCSAVTGSRCEFRVPGAGTFGTGIPVEWLVQGPHIRAEFEDYLPPNTFVTSGPRGTVPNNTATFHLLSDDRGTPLGHFTCKLDNERPEMCHSPKHLSGLADGPHRFEVYATDPSGNADAPAISTWTVDTVGPTMTTTHPWMAHSSDGLVTFDRGDAVWMRCSLDGGPEVDCMNGFAYSALADGVHRLAFRGWDPVGNEGRGSLNWRIDTQAPDTRIVSGPAASTTDTTASFTLASEAGARHECSLDGAGLAPCSGTMSYGGLALGAHVFEVRAIDAAGNVEPTPARQAWTVLAPPAPAAAAAPAARTAAPVAGGQASRVLPRVVWRAVANKRYTRITALSVEDLTAATKVTVSCKGEGCTLRKKAVSSKPGAKRLDLSRLLRKPRLRPGAVVTVRVAAPTAREQILRLKIQRGKAPKATSA